MAATLLALGPLNVVTPGTPVPLSALLPAPPTPVTDKNTNVHALLFQAKAANAGNVYIGVSGMNKSTLVGVILVLPIPTANLLGTFSISVTMGVNSLNAADFYLDADNAAEGAIVTALIT